MGAHNAAQCNATHNVPRFACALPPNERTRVRARVRALNRILRSMYPQKKENARVKRKQVRAGGRGWGGKGPLGYGCDGTRREAHGKAVVFFFKSRFIRGGLSYVTSKMDTYLRSS